MTSEKSFDKYLRQLAPRISRSLISEKAFDRILEAAKLLPELLVLNTYGFECSLNDACPNADFLVSFQFKNKGAELLQQAAVYNRDKNSVWADIFYLADWWKTNQVIDDFWLEFDIQGDAPTVPSLFFRPIYSNLSELEYILNHTLSLLIGNKHVRQLKEQVLQIVASLPAKSRVFQIGAMRSRPFNGIRLCIQEISLDAILVFLEKISYPGLMEEVKELLIFLQPITYDVTFGIDLNEELGSKIGFECYVNRKLSDKECQAAWVKMLDRLNESIGIDVPKMQALKKNDAFYDPEDVFIDLPQGLLFARALMQDHATSVICQYLHHIKVTYNPGHPLQTKAYLAIQHIWR